MKDQSHFALQRFTLIGTLLGLVSALIGSTIYTFISLSEMVFKFGFRETLGDFVLAGVIFGYSFAVTLLPASGGGYLLALWLWKDFCRGTFSIRTSVWKGVLIGFSFGISLGCIAIIASLNTRIPMSFIIIQSLKGLVLATLAGWWTGTNLASVIEKSGNY